MIDELLRLKKDSARLKKEQEILKKAAVFFAKVELLSDLLEISCSGYYAWSLRPTSQGAQDHERLIPKIKTIFSESRQTYGYRRVADELKKQQKNCGKHRTANLMLTRKLKVTTDSKHDKPIFTNGLNRQFNPSKINQAWTSDITYIATKSGSVIFSWLSWIYILALSWFGRWIDT